LCQFRVKSRRSWTDIASAVAIWADLVEDARRAPSPHNTQPWLLEVENDRHALLLCRPDRTLPVEDADGRFLTCGLGIFDEALRIAAEARGYALVDEFLAPDLSARARGEVPVARLALAEGPTDGEALRLLLARRTSRLPYDGRAAADAALVELTETGARHGHTVGFSPEPDFVRWAVDLNCATLFYDLAEDDRRAEIRHWTRTSEHEAARKGDGFSPSCLGFSGPLIRLFFDHHRAVRPFEAVLKRIYLRQMRGTATVGWIAGPMAAPEECWRAGRMLLRYWLAATRHGLVLQPFGSVITNPTAHARLDERLPLGDLWLLLRIGYSAEPPPSARLPVEALLR